MLIKNIDQTAQQPPLSLGIIYLIWFFQFWCLSICKPRSYDISVHPPV